jgi:murein DD-endopeptidase MepM/ murein hydrolase activator NlpD
MKIHYYSFLLFFCVISLNVWSQVENSKFKNGQVIEAPVVPKKEDKSKEENKTNTDIKAQATINTQKAKEESAINVGNAEVGGNFQLYKEATMVSRDTINKVLGDLQVVKISEELKIDCVWVKSAEYYAVWDSKSINPYHRDASLFKDTIDIQLYDRNNGELWAAPLTTTLQTSSFGYRWGRFHHGVDLNLRMGEPVFSAFDGIIRISAYDRGYGNYVVVRHKNGLETLYGHLSLRKVAVGQVVKGGQLLGLGGSTGFSTGPHLHFELRYEGNTFNPAYIYDFANTAQIIKSERFQLMPKHFAHYGNKIRQTVAHTVQEGETLSIISVKYNVSVTILAKMNHLSTNAILKVGQRLVIN